MTCKNDSWEEKICPYCKYDICSVRHHHNNPPIKGMEIVLRLNFKSLVDKKFFEKLSSELGSYLIVKVIDNPLITVGVMEVHTCPIK